MKDERILMVIIFASFFLRELWTIFPANDRVINPFPFAKQEINYQTYIWMMCGYVIPCLVSIVLMQYASQQAYIFFHAFFILAVLELAEYLLNYNRYWFTIGGVGVNITMIRYAVLSGIILVKLVVWKN